MPPVRHDVAAETTHEGVSLQGTKAASSAPSFDTRLVYRYSGVNRCFTDGIYYVVTCRYGKITDSGKITDINPE